MESETPPPPPTLREQRTEQLDAQSVLPSVIGDTGYPYYTHISANSGRFHNNALRSLSMHIQKTGSLALMKGWCNFKIYDHYKYLSVLGSLRHKHQSLITVGNHQSTIDDPGILAGITPWRILTDIHAARWSWCAREICFPDKFTGWFFLHGKCFPVVRGLGLYQQGMKEAEEHALNGEHISIFPEGKCIPLQNGIAALRWGTAKLIVDALRRTKRCEEAKQAWRESTLLADAATAAATNDPTIPASAFPSSLPSIEPVSLGSRDNPAAASPSLPSSAPCPLPPIVLPFVHHGMPAVMPFYHRVPRYGKTVRCIIGDQIQFEDLLELHERNAPNRLMFDYPAEEDLLISMTNRIHSKMVELDQKLIQIERDEGENPTNFYAPDAPPRMSWYLDNKL